MPVDATGSVSTKLGIYKYNTGADAPSGKGLNNIVDDLDDIISRLGIAGMVANDVPVYDSVAGKWKKATGTHDGTKFLRDDGSWATPVGIKTVAAYASGPPGSPSDGDQWLATDAMATGNDWLFRYRSADTYWHFIGGAPVQQTPAFAATSTSFTRTAAVAVRPGDWAVSVHAYWGAASSQAFSIQIVRDNRSADISSSDPSFRSHWLATSPISMATQRTLLAVTTSLDLWSASSVGASTTNQGNFLFQPIRIQ